MRLTTIRRGSSNSSAYLQTFSVCTSTPATASTTTSAASATRSAAARLGQEVRVAGRVEQVDLGLAPLAVGDGGLEADLALDLVGVEVGDGGAVVERS